MDLSSAFTEAYRCYRHMQKLEKLGTSPKFYGMYLQGKRKKKKRR